MNPRGWLVNLGVFIVATCVCLLIAEVGLRYFSPIYFCQPIQAYQYDKDLGYRLRPGMNSSYLTDYRQEIFTNKLGTLNHQEDFSAYQILVFALGDSYTQGLGVPPDASYPFQLDLCLNIDNNGNYTNKFGIVNLALGPYGGEQHLITLKRFAEQMGKPSIVLYLGADNDYNDDILFLSGVRHKNLVQDNPRYGIFCLPLRYVFMDTEIGKRVKYFFQETVLKARAAKKQKEEGQGRSVAELEQDVIDRIMTTCKALDAVMIVSWAYRGDSYDWLKKWATNNNIAFADWEFAVRSVIGAIPAVPMENDHSGGHHRAWVNSLIAREFAKKITPHPRFQPDQDTPQLPAFRLPATRSHWRTGKHSERTVSAKEASFPAASVYLLVLD